MLRFLLLVSACILSVAQEASVSDDFGSDKYISGSTTEVMNQTHQMQVEKKERDDISASEPSEDFKIIHKMNKPKAKKSVPLPLISSLLFLTRSGDDYGEEWLVERKETDADTKLNEVITEEEKCSGNTCKGSANKKGGNTLPLISSAAIKTLTGGG